MKRTRNGSIVVISTILMGIAFETLPGSIAQRVYAQDDKAAPKRGKITLYADFQGEPDQSSRGLHVVDPVTGLWTKVATVPPRNGVVSLHYLRVSPDGNRIVFSESKDAKDRSYAYPASVWLQGLRPGDEPHEISDLGGRPIWSPDGRELLLVKVVSEHDSRKPSRIATWKVGADGSDPVCLPIPEDARVEDWSADGRWLAAVSLPPPNGADFGIVVIRPDGTEKRRLTEPGSHSSPRISPDSRRVAYMAATKEGNQLWVVDLDGGNRRLIHAAQGDSFIERAAWSPDGKQLAAVLLTWTRDETGNRTSPGNPRLCLINFEDGSRKLIPHPPAGVLGDPDWR